MNADTFVSIPATLLATAARIGEQTATLTRDTVAWQPTSWQEYTADIRKAARALVALGMARDDAVAILGFNCYQWTVMAHATMLAGGKVAGVYWTSAPEEVRYVVNHAQAPILLVEDSTQLAKLADERPTCLCHVVLMRGEHDGAMRWKDFLDRGTDEHTAEVDRRLAAIRPEQIGSLIYTSGTTGHPKAVMLSHGALAWTAEALIAALKSDHHDRTLSYLPLAHIAEQMVSVHAHALAGYAVNFAQSLEQLGDNLKEVRPTIFFGVPRVWERMQKAIEDKLAGATGIKATLAGWAMAQARSWHAAARAGRTAGPLLGLSRAIARKLVLGKVKAALGFDQARWLYSGAAPIAPATLEFFSALDLSIREVFGMSESCGPTTLGIADDTPIGSAGQPLPGLQLKIAEDGELLIHGPSLFSGYAGMPDETAATLLGDWLATGDLARLDERGNLYLTGRKKDLLITSGGKNFSPANLEADLMNIPLIEHAVVCGDGRRFLSALITLRTDVLDSFCARHDIALAGIERHPKLLDAVQQEIDKVNARHARAAGIRKFTILERNLSIEGGDLTATLKIRRQRVLAKHKTLIEAMYHD